MRFLCIADEVTVQGFQLAGVEGRTPSFPGEASALLAEAAARPDIGIVVLTEEVAEAARDRVDAIRQETVRPLLVVIPGPSGPIPGHRSLRQVVQAAVGIRVGNGEEG